MKLVFPLYNEEIHILGRKGITDFDDLADRRVAIGREGSGTYLTARILLKMADITPREMVLIDTDEALAELKAGRIDAMFYVAGYPVKLFTEKVAESDGLALVPILNKTVLEFYEQSEIPAKTYAWQPSPVQTAAIKAVLVSFDFRRADCDYIGRFAQTVSKNMDWLITNGHPKWKSVDLDYPLRGWEQYDCVRKYLGKPVRAPAGARGQRESRDGRHQGGAGQLGVRLATPRGRLHPMGRALARAPGIRSRSYGAAEPGTRRCSAKARPHLPLAVGVGTVLEDRYRLTGTLEADQVKILYRAEEIETGRTVAVKVFHEIGRHDRGRIESFRRPRPARCAAAGDPECLRRGLRV